MTMNIKNKEAHDLARELAALTGESVTQAVLVSVRERLQRVRREQTAEERVQRIRELAAEVHRELSPETFAVDIDDLLYDENGMPK